MRLVSRGTVRVAGSPRRQVAGPREYGPGSADDGSPRVHKVAVIDPHGGTAQRLERLAALEAELRVTRIAPAVRPGDAPRLPADTRTAVIDVAEDFAQIASVRELHRLHPRLRIVAVGASLAGFDDVFDLGADVWIDREADDRALRVAVTGRGSWDAR